VKKRTGIAIDEDIYDYLKERNINVSGLVNSLLRTYVGGGESDLRVLDRQINEVRDEIDSLRDKLRIKESELRRLSKKKESIEEERGKEEEIIGKYVERALGGENIRRYYQHISEVLHSNPVEVREKIREEIKSRGENLEKYEGLI